MRALFQDKRWQAVGAQLARLALLLLTVALAGIGIAAAAIGIQAQRDETRGVDLLLVVAPEVPPTTLIEQSLDRYRRGYGLQIVIVGPGRTQARADLLGRGVPAEALLDSAPDDSFRAGLAAARQAGARSLLVVSAPADQLLSLKVAQDVGMRAYGSPAPAVSPDLLAALRAAIDYWHYALFYT